MFQTIIDFFIFVATMWGLMGFIAFLFVVAILFRAIGMQRPSA